MSTDGLTEIKLMLPIRQKECFRILKNLNSSNGKNYQDLTK